MKFINIIVEGNSEEEFVNEVLVSHFAQLNKFVSCRKITTGWDRKNGKPAKGGLGSYAQFSNEVNNWIRSDRGNVDCWYTSMIDLYAFPADKNSPFTQAIKATAGKYEKIAALETAIASNINHPRFIPYVQLHEFETFVLVDADRLLIMYPDGETRINRLKKEIGLLPPEEINDSPQTAPSKRIIKHLPEYEGQKAQVGPMVAADIGLHNLRAKCPHFAEWMAKLEMI